MKRVAALVLALALVAAAAVALRWRTSYQPLQIDGEAVTFGDHLSDGVVHPGGAIQPSTYVSGDFKVVEDEQDDDDTEHVATDYVDGQHFVDAVAIHNSGRVGVAITGFEHPPIHALNALIDIRVGDRLRGGGTSVVHTKAFRPFTIRAGETRDVVIRSRMDACEWYDAGTGTILEGVSLRYRVLGLSRRADLPGLVRVEIKRTEASCPRTTFTSSDHGIEFKYPEAWRAQQFASEPKLVTYLSNQTLHDPCVDNSCANPIDTLPANSVLVAWYDGPKGRVASENLFVAGQPAHKTYRRHGCPGIGDEEITVRFDNPALTTTYTMNACLRGPNLALLRRQVDAMLRSVRFL
ncbi:MAG: hypothetical protein QOK28_3524 [Actinomycetota bacterium]|jgi:hypothetical protein